jgi:hypothetical protein
MTSKDRNRRFRKEMARLGARRRRAALAGVVSLFLLPPLAAWIVLHILGGVPGGGHYYPLIAFIIFWLIVGISAVAAAVRLFSVPGGISRMAAELGGSSGKGSLFVSALEFARGGERLAGYSPFLVSETVRRAELELEGVDPSPVLASAGRPGAAAFAFLLGLVVLLLALIDPGGSLSLARYLSDPLVSLRVSPVNGLTVPGRDMEAVSGEDVTVSAVRLGSRRDPVSIAWSTVPGIWRREEVKPGTAGDGEAELESFRHTFTSLREDLTFRFESGGETTAETRIVVARRPVINRIRATLDHPPYTGIPPETIETLTGRITAPSGTGVKLSGETSVPVADGEIRLSAGGRSALRPSPGGFEGSFAVGAPDTAWISVRGENGLACERPSRIPIVPLPDRPPVIEILAPEDGDLLPRSQKVTLVLRAADDYGLSRITLRYMMERRGVSWKEIEIFPDGEPGAGRLEGPFAWSLEDERILPGDRVLFYLEAADNNAVAGPSVSRTETRALRAPTLSELYAESREREEIQRADMNDILEEGREIQQKMTELSEEIRAEGEMDWSRRSEAGDLLEQQRRLQEKLKNAADRLDETLERFEANRMTSAEVGEKLEQIQSLIRRIESEELRAAMEKLRAIMEEADPDQVAAAMQDMEMTTDRLMESLDRTIELLKSMLDEQRVEEMMRQMEEMIAEQRELRDSTVAGGDEETAESQEELAGEFGEFEEALGEFSEQSSESRTPGIEEMARQASSSGVDSLMSEAAADIRDGETEGASCSQGEAIDRMLSLYTRLGKCQMSMSAVMDERAGRQIERAIVELIETSKLQEQYASTLSSSGGKLTAGDMIGGQLVIRDAVSSITDDLYEVARRSLRISPDAFAELGAAILEMDNVMSQIESRKGADAARTALKVPERINLAAISLLEASSSSGSSAGGGGQGMQKLSGGQMQIDDRMRQMLGQRGQSWSMEQRAAMSRLAAEQRSMDELLQQILEEGGGTQQMLGDLSDVGGDMEEIARRLERGELDSELLEREERVLSRLLESQRSLNRRDYSRRRESRPGQDLRAVDPGPGSYGRDDREVLLDRIRRAMREKGPAEYEELNRLYFRALSGKARERR